MDDWEKFNESTLPKKKKNFIANYMQITCIRKEFVKTFK